MPQVSISARNPIGILTDSEERFSELAAAIGAPCVRLAEPLNEDVRSSVSAVVVDSLTGPPARLAQDRRRTSRRREAGRFYSRGRLIIYQCPDHID